MSDRKRILWMAAVLLLVIGGGLVAVNWENIQTRGRLFVQTGNPSVLIKGENPKEGVPEAYEEVFRKKIDAPPGTTSRIIKERILLESETPGDRDTYGALQKEVFLFCDYLDHRPYVESYHLEGGVYENLLRTLAVLSRNTPVISGETRDVYILVKNTAHFYRELKGRGIALAKDILNEEKDAIEPLSELCYEWIMAGVRGRRPEIQTSLKDLYIYASFFLETLGGKAYLARRDSRTRILIKYYSVLILDEANRHGLNHYGIDILPQASLLMDDISNQKGLEYRDRYLNHLKVIADDYRKKRS